MSTTAEIEARLRSAIPGVNLADAGITINSSAVEVDVERLAGKLGFTDSDALLPDALLHGPVFRLTDFTAPGDSKFRFTVEADFAARTGDGLGIPGVLELGVISAIISLDLASAAAQTVGVELTGKANIAGIALDLSANFPGGPIVIASIEADPSKFTMGAILQALQMPGAGFERLRLSKVALSFPLPPAFVDFKIEVDQPWSVRLGSTGREFSLGGVSLRTLYFPGEDGGLSASLEAKGHLGAVEFDVTGEHLGGEAGWTFTGAVRNVQVADILQQFGIDPAESPVPNLTVETVGLTYHTATKDFHFDFAGKADLSTTVSLDMTAALDITSQESGGFEKAFSGKITSGPVQFDLAFDHQAETTTWAGLYTNTGGAPLPLADLARALKLNVPADVEVEVRDVLFAYQKHKEGNNFFCVADTDIAVDLSGLKTLPIVGDTFAKNALTVSVAVMFASQDATDSFDLEVLRKALPAGAPEVPETLPDFGLLTRVKFGDFNAVLDIKVEEGDLKKPAASAGAAQADGAASVPATLDTAPPADPDNIKRVQVQRSFGPLHVQSVGVGFADKTISVLLEAELSVSGLTLSVEGLGARYHLDTRTVTFALQGLGLDFKRGDLELGGGFLNLDGDFAGKITIKTKTFSIAALGAVTVVDGQPAIFIYGLLNYPIGGPAFFYVEGLAAGFGYNRSFKLPAIDDVRNFPLVVDALDTAAAAVQLERDKKGETPVKADKAAIAAQLARLHEYVAPAAGEYFFAAGIKFSSFKLVNSFVLVAVVFGKKFEIDLIGVSTYQNPPVLVDGIPALARIELNVLGKIAPDEGVIGIEGRLTENSYFYSNLCQIRGGFAFYTWFGNSRHAGDFVLTVGGYHPRFVKPDHYPVVPRVSLTYQITSNIFVKGSAYFALTPSVLMAGGALEARAEVGSASAWFLASVDFLISWEPYHYDASLHLAIGAKWWVFEAELSAKLEIWGPEFSGRAEISWTVFTFSVEFGASASRGPVPIKFTEFRDKFLPDKQKVCTVRVVEGVRGSVPLGGSEVPVINPAAFTLDVRSTVPARTGILKGRKLGQIEHAGAFGVAPMDVGAVTASEITITLKRNDVEVTAAELDKFIIAPQAQSFPTGMWGTRLQMSPSERLVTALCGYTIQPVGPTRSTSAGIPRDAFGYDDPAGTPFRALRPKSLRTEFGRADDPTFDTALARTAAARNELLRGLGIDPASSVSMGDSLPAAFLKGARAPKVVTFKTPEVS